MHVERKPPDLLQDRSTPPELQFAVATAWQRYSLALKQFKQYQLIDLFVGGAGHRRSEADRKGRPLRGHDIKSFDSPDCSEVVEIGSYHRCADRSRCQRNEHIITKRRQPNIAAGELELP